MSEFRERLAQAMAIRGMKQVDLCAATGIAKSAVSQYLSGKLKPRQQRIKRLADALGVEPGWLLGFDSGPLDEREQRLISVYRCDPELKRRIDELIDAESRMVFRAAKSEDGSVAPGSELMSRERLERLRRAPETDQDL